MYIYILRLFIMMLEDSVHMGWLYLIVLDDLSTDTASWSLYDMIRSQSPEAKVGVMPRLEVESVPAYSQSIGAVLIYIFYEHKNTVYVTRIDDTGIV